MAFSKGRDSFSDEEILDKIPETELAALYLNISRLPCTISNPIRKDKRPSLLGCIPLLTEGYDTVILPLMKVEL